MDNTLLVKEVSEAFRMSGYYVREGVRLGSSQIDIVAEDRQGLVRKIYLIECADYAHPVGAVKMREDKDKLITARDSFPNGRCVLVHVARHGYTDDANGIAMQYGIDNHTISSLYRQMINFDEYIDFTLRDKLNEAIEREFQETKAYYDTNKSYRAPSLTLLHNWLQKPESRCLILLGDYGVGKSWLLRRLLIDLSKSYKTQREKGVPAPFLVPLHKFVRSFGFKNLVLKMLDEYNLSGAHYDAFRHLLADGRIVLLLDSFDEMAQHLSRSTIRSNLSELLSVCEKKAKVIITSRPNYFESALERILLLEGISFDTLHISDTEIREIASSQIASIKERVSSAEFARLEDLTPAQREKLFKIVLADKPEAYKTLTSILRKYQASIEAVSQRAVIARLLTTVAETLSVGGVGEIDGIPVAEDDLASFDQSVMFSIIVNSLLKRDAGIGDLNGNDRLKFLRRFAIFLQRTGGEPFASHDEIRSLVEKTFSSRIASSDTPAQTLENYYKSCRRHSGLTTEGQFLDTAGAIDCAIDDDDYDSRIGFSHNILREFLVSDSITSSLQTGDWNGGISGIAVTPAISDFIAESLNRTPQLRSELQRAYRNSKGELRERLFAIKYNIVNRGGYVAEDIFGTPVEINETDLSGIDLSKWTLRRARITNCVAQEVDMSWCDLRGTSFDRTILELVQFDGAKLDGADFREAEVVSLYVYDEFDTQTTSILKGKAARQWLFSRGALVSAPDELNRYLGKPWYTAAREVAHTIIQKHPAAFSENSLIGGTNLSDRKFASDFVNFMIKKGIIERAAKSKYDTHWVLKLNKSFIRDISEFDKSGLISKALHPFFEKEGLHT